MVHGEGGFTRPQKNGLTTALCTFCLTVIIVILVWNIILPERSTACWLRARHRRFAAQLPEHDIAGSCSLGPEPLSVSQWVLGPGILR